MVRWPGKIPSGRVSDLLFYQPDVLPTLAELTGATAPDDIDGISVLPEVLGRSDQQKQHEYLYWEYGQQVAVRMDNWKAIRPKQNEGWELYDLNADISETTDVSGGHPDVLAKMRRFATESHVPPNPGTYKDNDRTRELREKMLALFRRRSPEQVPLFQHYCTEMVQELEEAGIVQFVHDGSQDKQLWNFLVQRAEAACTGRRVSFCRLVRHRRQQ